MTFSLGLISQDVQFVPEHKYFVIAVDDWIRFTWVILCKSKCEVTNLFQKFISIIEF